MVGDEPILPLVQFMSSFPVHLSADELVLQNPKTVYSIQHLPPLGIFSQPIKEEFTNIKIIINNRLAKCPGDLQIMPG